MKPTPAVTRVPGRGGRACRGQRATIAVLVVSSVLGVAFALAAAVGIIGSKRGGPAPQHPGQAPASGDTKFDATSEAGATRPPPSDVPTSPTNTGRGADATGPTPAEASGPPAVAALGEFPGPTRTGVPTGTVLRPSKDVVVTTAGTVVDAIDIDGTLEIKADNVTVRRSRIRGSANAVVRVADGASGVLLEDIEVDGIGTSAPSGSDGVVGPATIRRANIHDVENGVVPDSGSLIEDSWIHDLSAPGSPHYDGVQIDGDVADVVVRHNSISVPDQTSAVMVNNYRGAATNITIESNLLVGGAYTVYADGQFSESPITNMRITNNRFGRHQFGYILVRNNSLAASSGNVDDATSQTISL